MARFVHFEDIGIITKGLREYEVYKNSISIPLLRAIGLISNPKNPARRISAGPPLEIPEAQCLGKNYAEFCVCFRKKPEELFEVTEKYYNPTVSFLISADKNTEIKLFRNHKNKILYGLKDKNTGVFYDFKNKTLKNIKI